MLEVRQTETFSRWLRTLRDTKARAKILIRTQRIEQVNFGDTKFFDGIGELRIDYGPGYRVYFARRGTVVIILLCGGDKTSQARDIAKAISVAQEL